MPGAVRVVPADLDDPHVREVLRGHAESARAQTAIGSSHALDLDGLRSPDIDVWAVWEGETLLGVGALRRLGAGHGEIKSMHTVQAARRRGAASTLLRHIVARARDDGLHRLSLETGSWPYFDPARAFYRRHGFVDCPPFGDYVLDPNSVFMTLRLQGA